jgi:hypothetical protein
LEEDEMKDEAKRVVASKGMGFVEATKLCAPQKMRRPYWGNNEYVYFENSDGKFLLFDEDGESFSPSSEDIIATDWEIVT